MDTFSSQATNSKQDEHSVVQQHAESASIFINSIKSMREMTMVMDVMATTTTLTTTQKILMTTMNIAKDKK